MTAWKSEPKTAGEMVSQRKRAAGEQAVAHVGVELGEFEALGKEFAVDVGEVAEFLVEIALALGGVGVEDAEELFQPDAQIGAVLGGAVAQEQLEGFLREDAVVLGKEAEEDADEEALEFVAGVAARLQGVVQVAHELRWLPGWRGLRG